MSVLFDCKAYFNRTAPNVRECSCFSCAPENFEAIVMLNVHGQKKLQPSYMYHTRTHAHATRL